MFLSKLSYICSPEIKTFYIRRHFYESPERSYIFSSRRFGHVENAIVVVYDAKSFGTILERKNRDFFKNFIVFEK